VLESVGRQAEVRRIEVQSQPGQIVPEMLSKKKSITQKGLVEWLKVSPLSSSPSTTKNVGRHLEQGIL
jgi:hypothetical protein